MKRTALTILAIAAMASCSKSDDGNFATDNEVRITSSIATRTVGNTWEANDQIGVYMTTHGGTFADLGNNVTHTTTAGDGKFESTTPLYFPETSNVDLLAYYPYSASTTDAGIYSVNVKGQLDQGAIDLMVENISDQAKTPNAVSMTFDHMLSRIALEIKPGAGLTESELNNLQVTLKNTAATATFDLTTGSVATLGATEDIYPFVAYDGKSAEAIVIPQPLSGAELIFKSTNYGPFSVNLANAEFAQGMEYNYTVTLNRTGVTISGSTIDE